ncbi:carbamoyltransferase HypF [Novosphingobium sp. FSY-8]|uniref:Carbamoyltransferase HypF n=1 Tax=Novosphingobium ovatum TaxID=1908523 RepID=A0ABW9X9N8_9SPHN|nr:carbamoyltransferase HypF [Novosphingobium ovatum]NBC35242.1 carbamoyltransferase HypF [Novosphingobium ovatum]
MDHAPTITGRRIRVRGLVQGVGFRPHVWRVARDLGLSGWVANDGDGVDIAVWGDGPALDAFAARLVDDAPPLARVTAVASAPADGPPPAGPFVIVASHGGAVRTGIVPDAATCPACAAEIRDAGQRRHGYAFTNCTHCGPRLTIAGAIPWDRARTAMAAFPMCDACAAEYADPADRRFHAQPIACPDCGPRLWLEGADADPSADPIAATADLLAAGRIVAVKGLGGFHLACDGLDAEAVAMLRARKRRDAKPFALMAPLAVVQAYAQVSPAARAALTSPAAPIVLLPPRADAPVLPPALAPDQDHWGWMLPYTPLHHLLCDAFAARGGRVLVMTSGNLSDEPQVTDNDAARAGLTAIADALLLHDRPIWNRLDDSVVALDDTGAVMPIRRARGYAPAPLPVAVPGAADWPATLAMGGELKATFCLLRDGAAVVSQHIGDLEKAEALADYRAMLTLYRDLHQFVPAVIAVDAHEAYLSTTLGQALAEETGARLIRVGHHHAHMVAAMVDAACPAAMADAAVTQAVDWDAPTLGVLLDGLGMGDDGTLWGGEILLGGLDGAARVGRFAPVPLLGGSAAMRQPWRNLVAHLHAAFGADWQAQAAPVAAHLPDAARLSMAQAMLDSGTNCPPCSSAGRLFDAAAAALGLYPAEISHEAQAAMALEALARPFAAEEHAYQVEITGDPLPTIGWAPLWRALLGDVAAGVAPGRIAARFHHGVAAAVAQAVARAMADHALPPGTQVALSGGVMQNRVLVPVLRQMLGAMGLRVLAHGQVPANDGGLALGQAVIAAHLAHTT